MDAPTPPQIIIDRLRKSVFNGMLCLAALFVLFTGGSDESFADSKTDEAKADYQKAVKAIAKNDWETAESELEKAAALAPANSLIHYDLALAFSHLGQQSSGLKELEIAVGLGLPSPQKDSVAELKAQLQRPPVRTGGARTSSDRSLSTLHALNALVRNDLGATTELYRPTGFTLERSTGKLWWSRVTDYPSSCRIGSTLAFAGAKLSELDPDTISEATAEGDLHTLNVRCRAGASCFEDWIAPVCSRMDAFPVSWHPPDSTEKLDKTFRDNTSGSLLTRSLVFSHKFSELLILTTGDPDATEKAITLLKQLIQRAGPPSSQFLAAAATETREREAAAQAEAQRQAAAERAAAQKVDDALSQLQGSWHRKHGDSSTAPGRVTTQFGSSEGNVRVYEAEEYNLTMTAPQGGQAAGVYTIDNGTLSLQNDSAFVSYLCFYWRGDCVTSANRDRTQTYDVTATVDSEGSVRLKMIHRDCSGQCPESMRHRPDLTMLVRFDSSYIAYINHEKFVKE